MTIMLVDLKTPVTELVTLSQEIINPLATEKHILDELLEHSMVFTDPQLATGFVNNYLTTAGVYTHRDTLGPFEVSDYDIKIQSLSESMLTIGNAMYNELYNLELDGLSMEMRIRHVAGSDLMVEIID